MYRLQITINSVFQLFKYKGVWEIPKVDFWEKLIFAGLGTHRICLLYANKYLQKRCLIEVGTHWLCLLARKINLSEIGVLLMCPDIGFAC